MLQEILSEYLSRFTSPLTESVYNAKGIEDYNYMRSCYDYLECDKTTLTKPRILPAGLRNIGNTCYLNTVIQLIFHLNYLRQKICTTQNLPTKLHQKLQFLFGCMSVGKMPFADPTEVFEELRAGNSDVFAPGVQNDFHEVFTLLIDSIGQGYKNVSPEESKFIKKLLFGKMVTRISYEEQKLSTNSVFNIINLQASEGSFSKAFLRWRHFLISDFVTPNGKKVTATCQNIFLQTPALLGFFVNRVTYKGGKLQKDCRSFAFDDSILVAKAFQTQKTVLTKSYSQQKQKEINQEKANLLSWLKKVDLQIQSIAQTIKYLKQKQVPLLNQPTNPMGQNARIKTLQFLQQQLSFLQKRVEAANAEIHKLNEQLRKFQQQQNFQRYLLWGVMIHEGNSAVFGHYKLCLQLGEDWFEFNDKIVNKISRQTIRGYTQRGEICCLFYRRPTLVCDNSKIPISFQLKTSVTQFEANFKKDIDKSRILQLLYQQTQSVPILLQFQIKSWQEDRYQFFFKPVHFALSSGYNRQICKGIILQELVRRPQFISSLRQKLICEPKDVEIPFNSYGIQARYFQIKDILSRFFDNQITFCQLGTGYNSLSKQKLFFSQSKSGEYILNEMVQAIILKGLYYLKVLSEYNCQESQAIAKQLNQGLDRMIEYIMANRDTDEFSLVCISIKASISQNKVPKKLPITFQNAQIQDYGEYFTQNFKFWINQRKNISKIDQTNYCQEVPLISRLRQIS